MLLGQERLLRRVAQINYDSILDKVYAYADSSKGQERMQKKINNYMLHNIKRTKAGSRVITYRDMIEAGDKLVQHIRSSAQSYDLPPSVAAHFDSLKRGRVERQPDGSYTMEINFTDDLTRESLEPARYGGVRNIVAIFNNGYPSDGGRSEAISHVSGWWHGKYTTALGSRQGLYFMQDAVNDFNLNYGLSLGMYAEVGAVYDGE